MILLPLKEMLDQGYITDEELKFAESNKRTAENATLLYRSGCKRRKKGSYGTGLFGRILIK